MREFNVPEFRGACVEPHSEFRRTSCTLDDETCSHLVNSALVHYGLEVVHTVLKDFTRRARLRFRGGLIFFSDIIVQALDAWSY